MGLHPKQGTGQWEREYNLYLGYLLYQRLFTHVAEISLFPHRIYGLPSYY